MGSNILMLRCDDGKGMLKVKKAIARLEFEIEVTSADASRWSFDHHHMIDGNTANAYRKVIEGLVDLLTVAG